MKIGRCPDVIIASLAEVLSKQGVNIFFLALMKYQVGYHLQDAEPPETRGRPRSLHPSEIMTILISFHQKQLSQFQGLLSTPRLRLSPLGVSEPSELQSLC